MPVPLDPESPADGFPLSEYRLELLAQQFEAAVLVEDAERRLHLTNQRFCDWFGIPAPPAALRGADCAEAARGSAPMFVDPDGFLDEIERTLSAAVPVSATRLHLVDGRVFERDYIPIWLDGTYRGHLWLYRDATEATRAEQQLRESRDALDYLLALVSHEVASPLAAVAAAVSQLRESGLSPEQAFAVDTLAAASLALEHAVQETAGRAREAAGGLEIRVQWSPLHIERVVRDAAALVRAAALQKGLVLEVDCAGVAVPDARGDAGLLRQVLVNLLQNAVRYTAAGSVAIRAHALRSPSGRVLVEIEVEDTGPGVPEEERDAIFRSGVRGRGETDAAGQGLGLALCRRIAAAMGGEVALSRSSSAGSVFAVRLELEGVQPAPSRRLAGRRVLVVEDDPSIARYVEHFLTEEGAAVRVATGVRAALAAIGAEPVDVAVVDVSLGDGPVADVLDRLARDAGGPGVLMVTGHTAAEVATRLGGRSVDALLRKPAQIADIIDALSRLVSRG
jgi:signal transduction histidine kinase